MRVSPTAKRREDNEGLRSLLVHRLSADTYKAVARIGLRNGVVSIFCEPCDEWYRVGREFLLEWKCPGCDRTFAMEFAVMEELDVPTAENEGER